LLHPLRVATSKYSPQKRIVAALLFDCNEGDAAPFEGQLGLH
jgi:hypothetical protein